MRTGKTSRSFRLSYIIMAAAVMAAAMLWALYSEMTEHTKEVLEIEISRKTSGILSSAIDDELSRQGGTFVDIHQTDSGEFGFAQTDTAAVNALENSLKCAVNEALEQMTGSETDIPLGTLTGAAPLVGKGPRVSIGLEQHGTADVVLESSFDSAGVNQTRHRLTLRITVRIRALLAGSTQNITVHDEYIISETVIAGRPFLGE